MLIEKLFWIGLIVLCLFYFFYFVFAGVYGRSIRYTTNNEYLPTVSLVVPTYNEESIIEKKIIDIKNLEYPAEKLEVIFVDSSNDGTRQKINQFKENSSNNVILLEENARKGLANALNLAYSAAHGEIVIKTDCDMFLERQSVKKIVSYFYNPKIGAVNGKLSTLNRSSVEEGYIGLIERLKIAESNLDSSYIFAPFSAYRKNLIEPINAKSVADDGELALKIRKKGYITVFASDAIFYEASPIDIKERIMQKSRRAQGHIRLIFQNLDILLNPKYSWFGTIIYPSNFFMMIVSPWLILILTILGFPLIYNLFNIAGVLLIFLILALLTLIYLTSTPKGLAGFIETQICLIIGTLNLILSGPDFMWTKNDKIREEYAKFETTNDTDL